MIAANRHAVCGQVARWLIHDLRGPAQALTLLTGILDDASPQDATAVAETLQAATGRVAHSLELLDRLLTPEPDSAAAPDGEAAGPVSLLDSLRFLTSIYRLHHTPVILDVDTAGADRLPAVRGVARDLELVLLNLVLNSLRALRGRAGGRIAMTPRLVGASVRLTVQDDGPGILPELQARLFEPFVSGWSGQATAGLGLAASRFLLERHGGSLVLAPRAGPGASFILELPAVD